MGSVGIFCPDAGQAFMRNHEGELLACNTTCLNWRCILCRTKRASVIKGKIRYGSLILKQCVFITLTLQKGEHNCGWSTRNRANGCLRRKTCHAGIKDARFVNRAWRALLVKIQRRFGKLEWLKIPEVTKQGMPHLHVIMKRPIKDLGTSLIHCESHRPKHAYDEAWRDKRCDCLEHIISRWWFKITKGSYVVDAREVFGSKGAAAYLGKYLKKGFYNWHILEALGFSRRWSASRNWPVGSIWLRGKERGWTGVGWGKDSVSGRSLVDMRKDHPDMQRRGDPLALKLAEELDLRVFGRKVQRIEDLRKAGSAAAGGA